MVTPRTKLLCQRMASDTDLWLSLKAAQAKYQSSLEATKESDQDLVINHHVEMPSLVEEMQTKKSSPSPSQQRLLNQEEFDRRLKAKRALFSGKGRSLSLASFSFANVKKVPKFLPLAKARSSSPKCSSKRKKPSDEKYLEDNKAQGELEILGLESLIDLDDVKRHK